MTSKQINIKKELAERLRAYNGSYSAAIKELFRVKEEYGKLRMDFDRKKTKRRTGLAYNGAAEEG